MRQSTGGQSSVMRRPLVDLLEAKARQASKLAEIREALIAAGCDTAAKQAAVLGLSRSTAWALLNLDKRAGPSAIVIKRILSSPNIPPEARRKVEEYVEQKINGLYGHSKWRVDCFRDQFRAPTQRTTKLPSQSAVTVPSSVPPRSAFTGAA